MKLPETLFLKLHHSNGNQNIMQRPSKRTSVAQTEDLSTCYYACRWNGIWSLCGYKITAPLCGRQRLTHETLVGEREGVICPESQRGITVSTNSPQCQARHHHNAILPLSNYTAHIPLMNKIKTKACSQGHQWIILNNRAFKKIIGCLQRIHEQKEAKLIEWLICWKYPQLLFLFFF